MPEDDPTRESDSDDVDAQTERELSDYVEEEIERGEVDPDELEELRKREERGHIIPRRDPLGEYGPEYPQT